MLLGHNKEDHVKTNQIGLFGRCVRNFHLGAELYTIHAKNYRFIERPDTVLTTTFYPYV